MFRSLFFLLLTLTACSSAVDPADLANASSYSSETSEMSSKPSLKNIQDRIQMAFNQAMMTQQMDEMQSVSKELERLYVDNPQNLIQYWRSYLQFFKAIFYIQKGDKATSEDEIDQGIAWLKAMKNKNSEDYALLSMLQGFSIQFKGMQAMFLSKEVKKNAKTALEIDPENLRAHFVYGNNDYYTPEQYGGGQEVETYLLKAISLEAQKTPNEYLPSWGKEEAYELLIKWYIKQGKLDEAKKHFRVANAAFPDNYIINQLASKLI